MIGIPSNGASIEAVTGLGIEHEMKYPKAHAHWISQNSDSINLKYLAQVMVNPTP